MGPGTVPSTGAWYAVLVFNGCCYMNGHLMQNILVLNATPVLRLRYRLRLQICDGRHRFLLVLVPGTAVFGNGHTIETGVPSQIFGSYRYPFATAAV